ncbi:MAG: sulfurtransferase TusA family protein [Candidatus Ozemobacteraceae bacterium]
MGETVEINAIGTKCPRPIIEIAKAFRRCTGDCTIIIKADDLAFESDVIAWCETTKNGLIDIVKDGPIITARIKIKK